MIHLGSHCTPSYSLENVVLSNLGQEILGSVEPLRLVQLLKDGDLFRLRISDPDEDRRESHLSHQLLHGEVRGTQVATSLDLNE